MKFLQTELFGEVFAPESFLELTELVIINNSGRYNNVRLWRGQSNIDWPIHSGAYRKLINSKPNILENDIINYEESLIKQARHKGYGKLYGNEISDSELLAKLQHHGAATRLVDFSKNSLVGLWFCVQANQDKTGLLLGVHTNFVGGGIEGVLDDRDYSDLTKDLSKYDHPMFIETPVVSKRIAAQHGVFLYSDVSGIKSGSLKLPKENNANLSIAITAKLKLECRKILIDCFDIRNETLFPDLDGFSNANSTNSDSNDMFRW
ncbi:FRG domain-containing protein [Paenibacillus chitinolyticus]|uniref:FRG domain-containing protein n=1 Tax=Paenibacillus chitinolyticus TaxID=79263 RepID=A0A410WWU8_9BACL|nr:FRG domain-containing protein [Paenibacillus chitinolyticus]MCY9594139.1 FRG domain-containing protein [Paenibacillus chitinolyticus]MCY9599654.1 FRG domain-containing protein [Paenibacillus chitinolyticus]QAV18844.1 FRG domain-containing protein [Paenibacillus chitinolyticus]